MPDKFETPSILHDLPLRDEAADFHFEEFAITLARLIASKHTRTPLTIGVSGSWGAGKTTLLQRLQTLLDPTKTFGDVTQPAVARFINAEEKPDKAYRACRTVWFNAWKYADEDALLVALVRKIVQTMADDGLVNQALGKMLDPAYPRRDVIATVLSWFSIKVKDVGVEINTGEPKETPFAEKTAMLDLFDDAFNRLMAVWVHRTLDVQKIDPSQGVLVIFIDDLDRCLPAKTVQVLEAVKLFLDKPGCVFVLGADIAQIERAVTAHYEKTGVIGETASDYLEKVIQLRFPLPPIEETKMQAFVSEIEAQGNKLITEEWGESWKLLITGAEVNPRKVKTILNDLSLQWAMLVNSGQAEGVNRQDFNAWQVLMRIAPRNFVVRVRDQIDDVELRFKFVMEAIEWVNGREDVAANYRDYDSSYRLKRVLKQLSFSETFDAATLEAFIHLTAPPIVVIEKEQGIKETRHEVETTDDAMAWLESLAAKQGARGEEELTPINLKNVVGIKGEGSKRISPREGTQTWGGIEFVRVPKGRFLMGSKDDNPLAYDQEKPQHPVEIPHDYWIGRYPVTNEQYNKYIQATQGHRPVEEWQSKKDHPIVNILWNDAMAYCKWLNKTHQTALPEGYIFRLPTEPEWEKAARGEYGNEWPWGNEWNSELCYSNQDKNAGTKSVGEYSYQGDSPYGVADMAGNVWEWTLSIYKNYPYNAKDGREDIETKGERTVRGGSFDFNERYARGAARYPLDPNKGNWNDGFRVVVAPPIG